MILWVSDEILFLKHSVTMLGMFVLLSETDAARMTASQQEKSYSQPKQLNCLHRARRHAGCVWRTVTVWLENFAALLRNQPATSLRVMKLRAATCGGKAVKGTSMKVGSQHHTPRKTGRHLQQVISLAPCIKVLSFLSHNLSCLSTCRYYYFYYL
jgi:hypothetical protein